MPRKKEPYKMPKQPFLAMTEEEYDADPEKYADNEHVVIFVDEADRHAWFDDLRVSACEMNLAD